MPANLFLIAMLVAAIAGAVSDVRSLTIPNAVSAAILGLYLPYALTTHMAAGPAVLAVGVAALVFVAGFGLFAAGLIGGGDAKLLTAVSLWAGPGHLSLLLLATSLAGGVLALLLLVPPIARALRRLRSASPTGAAAGPSAMPYGVAITAGALAVGLPLVG